MGKGGDRLFKPTIATPLPATSSYTTYDSQSKEPSSSSSTSKAHDFVWSATDEPHATRRKLILAKYPEIKQLYGHDGMLKYKITFVVVLQLICAYIFRHQFTKNATLPIWLFWLVNYVVGGTANHALFMAMHELSHNLAFKKMHHNRWFSMFANIPVAVPSAITFKRYHMDHHKYQGVDGIDVDIPTAIEGRIFQNALFKFFFLVFQVAFYSIRPGLVNYKKPVKHELINWAVIIGTDALIVSFWGIPSLIYLLLSSFFGAGLHPVAGHFIAEHYVFPGSEQETYSYYGPLNLFTFNVGYHNEHHDFPYIAGSRLPEVRRIAAEFYEPLETHKSYFEVMWQFVFNPEITAFSRVKRKQTGPDDGGVLDADNYCNKKKQ